MIHLKRTLLHSIHFDITIILNQNPLFSIGQHSYEFQVWLFHFTIVLFPFLSSLLSCLFQYLILSNFNQISQLNLSINRFCFPNEISNFYFLLLIIMRHQKFLKNHSNFLFIVNLDIGISLQVILSIDLINWFLTFLAKKLNLGCNRIDSKFNPFSHV